MVSHNHRDHDLDVDQLPVISFTDREQKIAKHIAALRNITYDPIEGGRVHGNQTSIEAHKTGVLGEMAVAKFLDGLDIFNLKAMVPLGDGGVDLRLKEKSIDVKTTRTDMTHPDLLVPERPAPAADWFILVHLLDDSRARLVGMASKETVLNHAVRRAPGTRRNYWVPTQDLNLFVGNGGRKP